MFSHIKYWKLTLHFFSPVTVRCELHLSYPTTILVVGVTLPGAHLDPQLEPSSWVMSCPLQTWLQLLSHSGDRILNQSLEKRDESLRLCCRPGPSAALFQQRERSLLSTRENVM